MRRNELMIHDAVRRKTDRAVGTVRSFHLDRTRVIVEWPSGQWTLERCEDLERVSQHPVTPTPMSGDVS